MFPKNSPTIKEIDAVTNIIVVLVKNSLANFLSKITEE